MDPWRRVTAITKTPMATIPNEVQIIHETGRST
jgi:hypothetical protein